MTLPLNVGLGYHDSSQNWINSVSIRDTSAHNSNVVNTQGFKSKCVVVSNTHNQTVTIQLQVSSDGVTFANVGSAQTVASGTTASFDPSSIAQLGQPYGYLRATYSCATAPTSGVLGASIDLSVL